MTGKRQRATNSESEARDAYEHTSEPDGREFDLPGFGPVLLTQFLFGHVTPRVMYKISALRFFRDVSQATGLWGQNVSEKCQIEQPNPLVSVVSKANTQGSLSDDFL